MKTLKTIATPDIRSKFEEAARVAGHRNFTRRGELYCVSDLNMLAEGFCMGLDALPPALAKREPATARPGQLAR